MRVFGVCPDVSYSALAGGRPINHLKGKLEGCLKRQMVPADALDVAIPDRADAFKVARPASLHDVLDAIIAA